MIERADLDAAVAAEVLTAEQRTALEDFVRRRRAELQGADEEHFRFITSFNDIFVTIAVVLVLTAVGMLAGPPIGFALAAAASWGFAEYFTRIRRMAFPSIVLLLAWVGGVVVAAGFGAQIIVGPEGKLPIMAVASAAGVAAAVAHWRRFHVPITVAAGAATAVGLAAALAAGALDRAGVDADARTTIMLSVAALGGVAVFALAMRYDIADRERLTRRTDIAFWLHLLAAPLIVHPLFVLLGLFDQTLSTGEAVLVIAIYGVLTLMALAIDRRALLVSALAYVIYAIGALFRETEAVNVRVALTCLVIGLFLVMLSAAWQRIRALVVPRLPQAWAARLPVTAAGAYRP